MRARILIYLVVLLLIFNNSSNVFANELPKIPETPALALLPFLPSVYEFGIPQPPDVWDHAGLDMPNIDFWGKDLIETEKNPQKPRKMTPIDPIYVATLAWPVHGRISSLFGPRGERMHEGIDIPVPRGTPIQAAAAGVVEEARTYRGYGYTVIIDHQNGSKTLYAHCSDLAARKGERVESGQVIAYAGDTGRASSSHVHFGVLVKGKFHDPVAYLKHSPPQLANKP